MPMTNLINVCAQCGQTGQNADKIPHHTSKVNYVRMVLHCAMLCISTSMRSKLRHSLADLSDVEVEQLHDEAVRAAVVDVRHAAHEVVVRRAQALQHVALTLQRALVLGAALEELQGHRGAFEVLLSDADKVQLRGHMSG